MLYQILAELVVVLHLAFVVFAIAGALLLPHWPRLVWLHVPALAWAALIEFAGWVCPLTPLENYLRAEAGQAGYEGGFLEHYLLGLLYPDGLTRGVQITLGAAVLAVNLGAYLWLARRRSS